MKKQLAVLILLGILAISPLAFAQEQTEAYSGFNRLVDNVRLFFSTGENKVRLALEIREKEVYSALNHNSNQDGSQSKELERARKKLLIVQEKVSSENANEVKSNVDKLIKKVSDNENLSKDFKNYILEEEKTQLTAELVIETGGKEGQMLKREIVKDGATGQKRVEIVVNSEGGEQRVVEIEGKINQIKNQIMGRVVETSNGDGGGDLKPEVEMNVEGGSGAPSGVDKAGVEVKTNTPGDGTLKNDPLPEPDLNKINPDLYDPDARAPGDTIDDTYDDEEVNKEPAGQGKNVIDP